MVSCKVWLVVVNGTLNNLAQLNQQIVRIIEIRKKTVADIKSTEQAQQAAKESGKFRSNCKNASK